MSVNLQRWAPNNPSSVEAIQFHEDDAAGIHYYLCRTYDSVYPTTGCDLAKESTVVHHRQSIVHGEEFVNQSWFLRVWSGNQQRSTLLMNSDYLILWDNGDVEVKTEEEMQLWGRQIPNTV